LDNTNSAYSDITASLVQAAVNVERYKNLPINLSISSHLRRPIMKTNYRRFYNTMYTSQKLEEAKTTSLVYRHGTLVDVVTRFDSGWKSDPG
jgi:hypothetical protein